MYSPAVIADRQARLEAAYREAIPQGLSRTPVAECHRMVRQLATAWDEEKHQLLRPLSAAEQTFIRHETLLSKIDYPYCAERYIFIQSEGQQLKPMFPLWESQRLILAEMARIEEARWRDRHPDGILVNILKGRQLGCSTLSQSLLLHRVITHTFVKTLIASDVPGNSGSQGLFGMLELGYENLPWWLKPKEKFHTKDQHLVLENSSSVIVESGKSMKGALKDDGGTKGQLGRSKTFSSAHLSELSTWENPKQIDDSLMPAIPVTSRTLMIRESTAKGRHNWWHDEWLLADKGLGRCTNIFIPFYAEKSKYWLPYPTDWEPAKDTLEFAERASRTGPKYMHRPVTLTKEQLYWYERRRQEAVQKDELFKFLEEYPAEPEESFQFSGRSIFPILVIDRMERQARPLLDLWAIGPHADLAEDRRRLKAELLEQQQQDQVRLQKERLRDETRIVEGSAPQRVLVESALTAEARVAVEDQP